MMIAPKHEQEAARLAALDSYNILDSLPEADYDNIISLAATICDMPMALVTLVDDKRQWFKAKVGADVEETPIEVSFCAHAILQDDVFMVPDTSKDERFADNPLVTGPFQLGFYAGVPLVNEDGLPLGTVCVLDQKPREFSEEQQKALSILGQQAMRLLELRRKKRLVQEALEREQHRQAELERFSHIAIKELKSPMANIANVTRLLLADGKLGLPDSKRKMMEKVLQSSDRLKTMLNSLWRYNTIDEALEEEKQKIQIKSIQQHFQLSMGKKANIKWLGLEEIYYRPQLFKRMLHKLIDNSYRYASQEVPNIRINIKETGRDNTAYQITVSDDGPGVPSEQLNKLTELFFSSAPNDKFGTTCDGIGLATLEKVLNKENGKLHISNILPNGLTVQFTLPKE